MPLSVGGASGNRCFYLEPDRKNSAVFEAYCCAPSLQFSVKLCHAFLRQVIAVVPGGCAAWNRGADFVQLLAPALAPEQGAGPDTVNRTIKLRLLARPTAPVSTAIS